MTIDPSRRRALVLAGSGLAATAGCLSQVRTNDDEDPTAGSDVSDEGAAENATADDPVAGTVTQDGIEVPLVSIDDAYEWYREDTAVFVDARGEGQYENTRIAGALWSPAPDGREDDPVADRARDARIVTYCGCPHHLSSMRAASLLEDGYETVYALDEGIVEWVNRDYPLEGADVDDEPALRVVRGYADPDSAGEMVIAEHRPSKQREAAPIGDGGGYELHVRFADLASGDRLTIEAPGYSVTAPLSRLEDGVVERDGTVR